MTEFLCRLIRTVLWTGRADEDALAKLASLDECGWMSLINEARRQTVSGLLYKAAEALPEDSGISEKVLFELMADVNLIVNYNMRLAAVEKEISGLLGQSDVHPIVMKGSSCAARYPFPELRTGGDVDFYIREDEFSKGMEALRGFNLSSRPDGSVEFTHMGCEVELHRDYYDLHVRGAILPDVGSPEAELVMLSAHILKHACGVGVGLRQICDFALAYCDFHGDYDVLADVYRRCGLEKWNNLLLSFVKEYLCPAIDIRERVPAGPLMNIVRKGGNFGQYSSRRMNSITSRSSLRRKTDTAIRLLAHIPFSMRYAPGETFPLFASLIKGNCK